MMISDNLIQNMNKVSAKFHHSPIYNINNIFVVFRCECAADVNRFMSNVCKNNYCEWNRSRIQIVHQNKKLEWDEMPL